MADSGVDTRFREEAKVLEAKVEVEVQVGVCLGVEVQAEVCLGEEV
jgi:hypothetical protein